MSACLPGGRNVLDGFRNKIGSPDDIVIFLADVVRSSLVFSADLIGSLLSCLAIEDISCRCGAKFSLRPTDALGSCVSSEPGKSCGIDPVHPPSHNERHSPSCPTVGANRRTSSHDLTHSMSAIRDRQAATLRVVQVCF